MDVEISIPNSVCLCFGTINVVNPKTNLPCGDGLYNIIQPIYDDFGVGLLLGLPNHYSLFCWGL